MSKYMLHVAIERKHPNTTQILSTNCVFFTRTGYTTLLAYYSFYWQHRFVLWSAIVVNLDYVLSHPPQLHPFLYNTIFIQLTHATLHLQAPALYSIKTCSHFAT